MCRHGQPPRHRPDAPPRRLQIFYRRQPHTTVHHFRFIADFPCALVEVLALAREFDLISSWNWTIPDSVILSERSDMDLSAYAVVRMPWPYHNRFAAVRAQGSDCLQEEGCANVIFASCPCVRPPPPHHYCAYFVVTSSSYLAHACHPPRPPLILPFPHFRGRACAAGARVGEWSHAVKAGTGEAPCGGTLWTCVQDDLPPSAENADRVDVLEGSGVRLEPCWKTQQGRAIEWCVRPGVFMHCKHGRGPAASLSALAIRARALLKKPVCLASSLCCLCRHWRLGDAAVFRTCLCVRLSSTACGYVSEICS